MTFGHMSVEVSDLLPRGRIWWVADAADWSVGVGQDDRVVDVI